MKELKRSQYDISIQLEDHTRADESYYVTASTVLNLAKNALELFQKAEVPEKRALLNYLLQNSVVDGKKLSFSLRTPFNTIFEYSTSELIKFRHTNALNEPIVPNIAVWLGR